MSATAILLLIGILCVVNASIVSINIYDELSPIQSRKLASLRDCNYQACDQLCRRLGFPGGACVGDRCQCDNFKPKKDILNMVHYDCDIIQCDYTCQRLNYAGGTCSEGSCECY